MNDINTNDTKEILVKKAFLTNEPKLEKRRFWILIMFFIFK